MTVREAKEKWCPMARVYFSAEDDLPAEGPCNKYQEEIPRAAFCIADECMLWRWTDEGNLLDGYCGLGGKS